MLPNLAAATNSALRPTLKEISLTIIPMKYERKDATYSVPRSLTISPPTRRAGRMVEEICFKRPTEVDQVNSLLFTTEIEQAAPLKQFSMPSFTPFKWDSDPESHLKHFKSIMILYKAEDALMCKVATNIQHMGMKTKVNKSAKSLIGFNGATTITVGMVELDVYSPPVISTHTFMIIDEVSPYNSILRRPWIVTQRGIEAHPNQIKLILNMKSLATMREIQSLMGITTTLNRFLSRSTYKCRPFFKALMKGQRDKWDEECEVAFQNLKTHLTSPPLLSKPVPDFVAKFTPSTEKEKMVNIPKESSIADETSSADHDKPKDMW
ncbi:unnamed protein product [Prunus brigantina]